MSNPPWSRANLIERLQRPADDLAALRTFIPKGMAGTPDRTLEPPPGAPSPRRGAVLLLLYPVNDAWYLPLTVRTAALRQHSGEVSLPGGRYDETDGTLEQTALREAWEEIGVETTQVEVVATLTQVWIPVSNFTVLPVVGITDLRPQWTVSAGEVGVIIEAPLTTLLDPTVVHMRQRLLRGQEYEVPFFAVEGHEVWGATALVLAQFVNRLRG